MNNEEIHQKIHDAIMAAKAKHIPVRPGFGGCCAFDCLNRYEKRNVGTSIIENGALVLDVTEEWVWSFIDGFDDKPLGNYSRKVKVEHVREAYEMGKSFRSYIDV